MKGAKRVLLQLYCSSEHPIIMQEFDHIHAFVHEMGDDVEVQWGVSLDETLGENVRVTLIATGFEVSDIPGLDDAVGKKTLDEAIERFYGESNPVESTQGKTDEPQNAAPTPVQEGDIVINLEDDLLQPSPTIEFNPAVDFAQVPATELPKQEGNRSGIAGWMRGRR